MKIISKNKPWNIQVECSGQDFEKKNAERNNLPCGATLEISGSDIFCQSFYNRTGAVKITTYLAFKCPCCKCITSLTDEQIENLPKSVLLYAQNRTETDIDCENIQNTPSI